MACMSALLHFQQIRQISGRQGHPGSLARKAVPRPRGRPKHSLVSYPLLLKTRCFHFTNLIQVSYSAVLFLTCFSAFLSSAKNHWSLAGGWGEIPLVMVIFQHLIKMVMIERLNLIIKPRCQNAIHSYPHPSSSPAPQDEHVT